MNRDKMREDALQYIEILSEIGIRSSIDRCSNTIKEKYFETVEVEAGRLYNPYMKDGILRELNSELEYEKEQLDMFHLALKLKLGKSELI